MNHVVSIFRFYKVLGVAQDLHVNQCHYKNQLNLLLRLDIQNNKRSSLMSIGLQSDKECVPLKTETLPLQLCVWNNYFPLQDKLL